MARNRGLPIAAWLLLQTIAAPRDCRGVALIFKTGFETGTVCSWTGATPVVTCDPPAPSQFLLNGASGYPTPQTFTNPFAIFELHAASAGANVSDYCIKQSAAPPAPEDACWRAAPGAPAPALEVSGEPVRLGFVPAIALFYAFVRDDAGRVSTLLPGSDGEGKDHARAGYDPGVPPVVSNFFVTTTADACPEFSIADLDTTTSPDLYLRWNVEFDGGQPGQIDVAYTTDDVDFVAMPGSPLANDDNGGGCVLSVCGHAFTGCAVFQNHGLPSTYVRFRLRAEDAKGNVTVRSSVPPLNVADKLRFVAGNPDPGIYGSARSAVFNHGATERAFYLDPHTLVVDPRGAVFFLDRANGLLWVDPATGILRPVARTTGVATDGPLGGTATFQSPAALFVTHEGDVLVWDGPSIRRIVLDSNGNPDQLETVIATTPGFCSYCSLVALPGGDFYFVNEAGLPGVAGWRIFRSTGGSVDAIVPSGTGYSGDPGAHIETCVLYDLYVSYDPADGTVRRLHAGVLPAGECAGYGYVSMDAAGVSVTTGNAAAAHLPFPFLGFHFFTGLDGFVYRYSQWGGAELARYDDRTNLLQSVLGAPNLPAQPCVAGTLRSECNAFAQDVFIDPHGAIFWSSLGKIRSIEFDDKVVDVYGQGLDYGEGGDALDVRIPYASTLGVWNDGTNDRVTYLDNVNAQIREAIVGGNVLRRAGNGVLAWPLIGGASAPNEPLYLQTYSSFLLDPDGKIYLPSYQQIMSNTDPASPWQTFAGLGATPYWQAADDTPGDEVQLDFYDAIPFGSTPNRVAFAFMRWNNVEWTDGMVKSFARSDGSLRHLAGVAGGVVFPNCADGTLRTACGLAMHYYSWSRTRAVFDAPRTRWVWQGFWGDDDFFLFDDDGDAGPPGALKGSLGGSLGFTGLRSWTYRFEDPYDVLYVCGNDGRLAKATLDGGVWTIQTLPWPILSLSCSGQDLVWSLDGKRLLFPYRQFGLGGIAAYVIDP